MPWTAFLATRTGDDVTTGVEELADDALPEGEVTIDVEWSSVNYKDALATVRGNRVTRRSPLVLGIDLAGTVSRSESPQFSPGDTVLAHGYDIGVDHHGGFATRARVPAAWVVGLPDGLSARHAAAIGTAGFTAVASLEKLRQAGIEPGDGPIVVTGATGGVGSSAVAALSCAGYEVVASTGKESEHGYLTGLGASRVVGRDFLGDTSRSLTSEEWAGAIDCVGGETLARLLRAIRYGGAVAASGLTAGTRLETTVFPFIVRGISLLGVDSVQTPIEDRRRVWAMIDTAIEPEAIDAMVTREVGLSALGEALADVLAARTRGRILVAPRS